MRILQIAHRFLPESRGGTEIQTHLLAKALQERHEVAVCTHHSDPGQPEHALLENTYDGLPVYRLINNFTWDGAADYFFHDPGQDAPFERILDRIRPDVVHFHHLGGGLSTSFPEVVRRRGIPALLTLHDFWPMCYRSHLLTTDGQLCPGPDGGLRCGRCWQLDACRSQVNVRARMREIGWRKALTIAPRFLANAMRQRVAPPAPGYHTTRLMVRDGYFRRLISRFDLLIAPSQFLRARYLDWGIVPERIQFLRNGIPAMNLAMASPSLPMGDSLSGVYLGSLLPHKGLDVLIDAFNLLIDVPITLSIRGPTTGSPETERYVRSLRSRSKNPGVRFEGGYAHDDVGRILSGADLVIVPSILYENCPTTVLEAFWAGRPVIASNIGGMAELVRDGVNGLTFRVGDPADLARVIRRVVTDRNLLLSCQAQIEKPQTIAQVAERVEQAYDSVIAARHQQEV